VVYSTRAQTRSDHFLMVRERAGFRAFDDGERSRLEEWLVNRARERERPKPLHALLVRVISHDVSRSARPVAVIVGRPMDGPPAASLWEPAGFLNRETSRELDDLLKPYTDSLGPRAQPAELAAAMQAAAREITVMLSPALRHHRPRRQAAA
jgi:hypothetical protein